MEKMFDRLIIMSKSTFTRYKQQNNTIPICISCGIPILVNKKYKRFRGRKMKFVCEICSKKEVIVFQYPISRNHDQNKFKKKENLSNWIHGVDSYTSQ